MSTVPATRPVKVIGVIGLIAGLLMIGVGAATWGVVSAQLSEQDITVSDNAPFAAGTRVDDPLAALAQAEAINEDAMQATGGKTYAELDRDDPVRATAQTASFLRASLFTSVIAFGVALLVFGLGVILAINGFALTRVARAHRSEALVAEPVPA